MVYRLRKSGSNSIKTWRQILSGVMTLRDAEAIRNRDVLLIDDIYTTGATVDGAAEVLLAGGARQVYVLTFAAGADVVKSE